MARSCLAATAIAGLVAGYIYVLQFMDMGFTGIAGLSICSIIVSFLLAKSCQRREKIDWRVCPLGWILGLIPIYNYYHHIAGGGFFGKHFNYADNVNYFAAGPLHRCPDHIGYLFGKSQKDSRKKPKAGHEKGKFYSLSVLPLPLSDHRP